MLTVVFRDFIHIIVCGVDYISQTVDVGHKGAGSIPRTGEFCAFIHDKDILASFDWDARV